MAKQINLGKVVGSDAKINGVNAVTLQGENGIEVNQSGEVVTLSSPGLAQHTSAVNPHNITPAGIGAPTIAEAQGYAAAAKNEAVEQIMGGATSAQLDSIHELAAAMQENSSAISALESIANGHAPANHNHDDRYYTETETNNLLNGKQNVLSGTPSQYVGFDEEGKAVAKQLNYSLFGFELNLDESNPDSKIRYIEANANYQAAATDLTSGVLNPGDWGDAWFMKDLHPVVLNADGTVKYELNKNNYQQKVDGTPIDVTADGTENVMLGFPTVWVKVDNSNPRKPRFYFSNVKFDVSYHAYAHTNTDGIVVPYIYLPVYNGWVDRAGKMRSLSGKDPNRNMSGTDQIAKCRANNIGGDTIWDMEDTAERQLLTMLLWMIGKSTNTQDKFGNGNMNGYNNKTGMPESMHDTQYGVLYTGTMDDKGLWFGSSADNVGVKVFGIENFWGNVWRRTQGLINDNGKIKAKMTRGAYDGTSVNDYNVTGAGYREIGDCPTASASYISDMYVSDFGCYPSVVSGSASTYFCDAFWSNNGQVNFALFGGNLSRGSYDGASALTLDSAVSIASWYYGASASCKPKVA